MRHSAKCLPYTRATILERERIPERLGPGRCFVIIVDWDSKWQDSAED
jgi:hypothetical protein